MPRPLYALAAASFALSMVIVHRWAVTPLGVESFGRVWLYFVSWTDFGFFRRGLVGTVLTVTGLNGMTRSEYVFTYGFFTLQLAALYGVFVVYLRRRDHDWWTLAVIFFSPALFLQCAYATGTYDVLLLLITAVAVFFVESLVGVALLCVLGILVHELYLFHIPFVLRGTISPGTVAVGLALAGFATAVAIFGKVKVPEEIFTKSWPSDCPTRPTSCRPSGAATSRPDLGSGTMRASRGSPSRRSPGIGPSWLSRSSMPSW